MKTLIVLTAIPGAGKSTWADLYCQNHPNSFIVSSDEIRKQLGGTYQYFKEEEKVWSIFNSQIVEYSKNFQDVTVILDATNSTNDYRKKYYYGTPMFDKHILVYFPIDIELALKNNVNRDQDKIVPEDILRRMNDGFELPSDEVINIFDEYLIIK